jgi:hypothetical protein
LTPHWPVTVKHEASLAVHGLFAMSADRKAYLRSALADCCHDDETATTQEMVHAINNYRIQRGLHEHAIATFDEVRSAIFSWAVINVVDVDMYQLHGLSKAQTYRAYLINRALEWILDTADNAMTSHTIMGWVNADLSDMGKDIGPTTVLEVEGYLSRWSEAHKATGTVVEQHGTWKRVINGEKEVTQ